MKVIAYITRDRGGKRQLLVFRHWDYPEAGVQVPAGTVKQGESIEAALAREVAEETGLGDFLAVEKLATYSYRGPDGQTLERHVFHLAAPEGLPDEWEWLETGGGEKPDHEGYVFQFFWTDLDARIELAGGLGEYLHLLVTWAGPYPSPERR